MLDDACEREVRELGQRIFELAGEESPSIFDSRWWSGKMIEWSIRDERFKTEMFRFVDVFPALATSEDVARHLEEYFCRDGQDFPAVLRWGLRAATAGSVPARAVSAAARKNMEAMARRFIAGSTASEALALLAEMWRDGVAFSVDLLGEATLSEREAVVYRDRYLELLDVLAAAATTWPEREILESAPSMQLPRVNVSVKLTALSSHVDPMDFAGSVERLAEAALPLFVRARALGAFLNLDVEQYVYKDLTYAVFRRLLETPELEGYEHAGIVCQAYLRDAYDDLQDLFKWARGLGRAVTVRLVKGAYWDYEVLRSRQAGHRCPVFTEKEHTDASFERCVRLLIENADLVRPAIATHSVRSLAFAMVVARHAGLDPSTLEIQMLYGMAEPIKNAVRKLGYRLREYVPIGTLIPGMAYLVRRLLENTSNESFLRASFIEGADRAALLAPPDLEAAPPDSEAARSRHAAHRDEFVNEPHRDFTCNEQREAFAAAIEALGERLASGKAERLSLLIGGEHKRSSTIADSRDPADPSIVVAHVCQADAADADAAVQSAHARFAGWRSTSARVRAEVLFAAADYLRRRRDETAALQVYEVGKPWREADADVCEAIDFLEYYGRRMLDLGNGHMMGSLPGERNELVYEGRGVAAVISPWNFPLAIVTGMTAAALVAGNTVVVKPAEQSPATAWRLIEALHAGGAPAGVVSFVPGRGEIVGARLVAHPLVRTIAFTGSMAVGLEILEEAARRRPDRSSVKRVIAEMGGKNAIIVDDDADLDAAVEGVVASAFGYSGQKCSACSRAIVLAGVYDVFLARLVEAVRSLRIGPPREPATQIGPVVDEEQLRKIQQWQTVARAEGRVVLEREVPAAGLFAAPMIVADIRTDHSLAQEEVFGPLLAVMRAADFDDAVAIANSTRYALTGGIFSRSPAHIERAREELAVGNLYINRGITGAFVGRQPFGGFRLSGVGSKAGGPDYLLQFLEPRTVTENTVRRGFTPEL